MNTATIAKWHPSFTDPAELLAYADALEDSAAPDTYAASLYRSLGAIKIAAPGLGLAPTVRSLLAPFCRKDEPLGFSARCVRAINSTHDTLLTDGRLMFHGTPREKESWRAAFAKSALDVPRYDPSWVERIWPKSSGAVLSSTLPYVHNGCGLYYLPLTSADPSALPHKLNAIFAAFLLRRYPSVRFYAPSRGTGTIIAHTSNGIVAVCATCG